MVAIDYFIRWIEAKSLAKIAEARVKDFIWKSLVCCFGLLKVLIIDNGHQFNNIKLAKFYKDLGIIHYFTSVGHLQANKKAKVANRTLL